MIVWMRRHARGLKHRLEGARRTRSLRGSVIALVAMAFFAVIREGFETAVFLLAAFDASTSPVAASAGRCSGSSWPSLIGYGIYRGGVRINLRPVLPGHGRRARAGRRGARRDRDPHRARGRLVELRSRRRRSTSSGSSSPAASARRSSPACSACSRSRPWARLLGYLLYAVPMLLYRPVAAAAPRRRRRPPSPARVRGRAARHEQRSRRSRRPGRAVARCLAACGSSGSSGDGGSSPARARSRSRSPTPAAAPEPSKAPAGPATFEVQNDGADKVTEFELLDGDRSSARPRTSRRASPGTSR